jgi:hypothetical protein
VVRTPTVVTLGMLALATSPARSGEAGSAVTPAPRWRVLAGGALFGSSFQTTYVSSYSPPFEFVPHTSSATQTLPLDASAALALRLGVERALGAHVGLQLLGGLSDAELSGEPGQYDLRATYTSRPPPSNEPVAVTLRRSEARPEATGRLETLALSLNLSAWLDLGPRARLGVSAGPTWQRTSGNAERLVFTSYTLGGHSVLFSEDHLVSFDFVTSGLGVDVGSFVDADLGRVVGVHFDVRYVWGPERDADVTLGKIVNASEIIRSIPLREIEASLAPPPLRLDPSFVSASLELVFRF